MTGHRAIALAALTFAMVGCFRAEPEQAAEVRETDPVIRTTVDDDDSGVAIAPMPRLVGELDLPNEDLSDPTLEPALPEIERLDKATVEGKVTNDSIGSPDLAVPGVAVTGLQPNPLDPPAKEKDQKGAFAGRTGEAKAKLLKQYGGTDASEKAVELGLAWLAKQQQKDGGWVFDQGQKEETAAATGLAMLAFLGAGETHKTEKGKYKNVVKNGLNWLMKNAPANGAKAGQFAGAKTMYAQAIATLALVEAYGMTKDATLKPAAQAAVNYIQKGQVKDGSWGYTAGAANGDTSILGWQVQALYAAKHAGLVVDAKCLKSAVTFLDKVAAGKEKSIYGYSDNAGAAPGTALTAIGLWSRACIDSWEPKHPGMADGVAGLLKRQPPRANGGLVGVYYYYYATQVVRFTEGDEWKTWNEGPKDGEGMRKGGLRDWLVERQITKDGANLGSWDPEVGFIGTGCGRLGTTAICILNLEVYYRYAPVEKVEPKPKK